MIELRKFIIHKLGGILPDEASPLEYQKIDVTKAAHPIVTFAGKITYEPDIPGAHDYALEKLAKMLGEKIINSGVAMIESEQVDDWTTQLSARVRVVDIWSWE